MSFLKDFFSAFKEKGNSTDRDHRITELWGWKEPREIIESNHTYRFFGLFCHHQILYKTGVKDKNSQLLGNNEQYNDDFSLL